MSSEYFKNKRICHIRPPFGKLTCGGARAGLAKANQALCQKNNWWMSLLSNFSLSLRWGIWYKLRWTCLYVPFLQLRLVKLEINGSFVDFEGRR